MVSQTTTRPKMDAATAQARRTQRAREQFASYRFRLVTIKAKVNGQPRDFRAVYVMSPDGAVYTVNHHQHHPTCNCPSYQRSCAGTTSRTCKHIDMTQLWLDGAVQGEVIPPFDIAAAARIQRAYDERDTLWG